MIDILAATSNAHKIREMNEILAPTGIHLLSPDDLGGIPDVVEDGSTFSENAVKKACEVAQATGYTVIADDSGLEVEALAGAPGVFSARYAGEGGNDGRNVAKLLRNLDGVDNRRARFVCVIAVASPEGLIGTAAGEVKGRIIDEPCGEGGFGYDPVFVPDGEDLTFAQLPAETKNSMSHRKRALQGMLRKRLLGDRHR